MAAHAVHSGCSRRKGDMLVFHIPSAFARSPFCAATPDPLAQAMPRSQNKQNINTSCGLWPTDCFWGCLFFSKMVQKINALFNCTAFFFMNMVLDLPLSLS